LNPTRTQFRQKDAVPDRRSEGRDEPPRVDSRALLGECGRLVIDHGGERYTLSKTRADKLILTK